MAWLNRPARPSRRRVVAFLVVFLPAAAASLIYVYSQPPEYRAVARLRFGRFRKGHSAEPVLQHRANARRRSNGLRGRGGARSDMG
jgi:uncharacterized protein involved in exopolysaccharide biosynthesis